MGIRFIWFNLETLPRARKAGGAVELLRPVCPAKAVSRIVETWTMWCVQSLIEPKNSVVRLQAVDLADMSMKCSWLLEYRNLGHYSLRLHALLCE